MEGEERVREILVCPSFYMMAPRLKIVLPDAIDFL